MRTHCAPKVLSVLSNLARKRIMEFVELRRECNLEAYFCSNWRGPPYDLKCGSDTQSNILIPSSI